MNSPDHQQRSRWLSWALRHDPGAAGLVLDQAGWTEVAAVLAAAGREDPGFTRRELEAIVATSDKRRFAFSPDGTRIRANQGHSVPVDLGLPAVTPPAELWHGTADRFLPGILRDGLRRQARHHVHLSAERATASAVGTRHGRLVLLRIDAAGMHAAGIPFYRSENGVWLVDGVPPGFIGSEPTSGSRPASVDP